ncbi:hypothetical protein XH98_15705 [Bradyrhizobium sp. CCBAU 51745]|nr:hypothetical protein [Bradyrhizobium sp. CCBAU 51745]
MVADTDPAGDLAGEPGDASRKARQAVDDVAIRRSARVSRLLDTRTQRLWVGSGVKDGAGMELPIE